MALFDLSSPGWKALTARWPPGATPGTAGKARCRSSTACSPTLKGARSRSASSPATPATRPRSPASRGGGEKFGLQKMVMAGDRGMITGARIEALNQPGRRDAPAGPLRVDHRAARPRHQKADGRRRPAAALSLFDEQDLAEITSQDFPGERLIACRNPRARRSARPHPRRPAGRHRKLLAPLIARVTAGRLAGAAKIGLEVGKVINKYKTGKHFWTSPSPMTAWPSPAARPRSTPKPPWTGSTSCAPPSPPASRTPPPWSPPTKTSSRVERDFRTSNLTTWTCARSSTGWKNASKPTC